MKIGNTPKRDSQIELKKWYIGIEIRSCSPQRIRCFKPWIRFVCVKFTDFGEPAKINGAPDKKIGGWWTFESPIGIIIEIIR